VTAAGHAGQLPDRGRRIRWAIANPALCLCLLVPLLGLLTIGFFLPVGQAVVDSVGSGRNFGVQYRAVAHNAVFWLILRRTFETAGVVTAISVVLAYPAAELINRARPRLQPVLLAVVVVPLWSSSVARTYGWLGIFERGGLADTLSRAVGGGYLGLLFTRTIVIIGMVHVMLPYVLLPIYAGLRRYDERLTRASTSLGAGPLRTLFSVKLPMLAPQIVAAATAVFIISLGFFITPAILGGANGQMISNIIYQQVTGVEFNINSAYAMSVVLLGATLAVLVVFGGVVGILRRQVR
jgi:ABC-type spermidine/putrescine transport system permease subunit I